MQSFRMPEMSVKGTRLICEVLGHQQGSDKVIQEGEAANRSLLSQLLSSAGKCQELE